MKTRCHNEHGRDYPNYGGRGITVCDRWEMFANFLEDMGPSHREGLTLDRIDTDGNYTPENCRWIIRADQNRNRRDNVKLEYQGESLTLGQWAERLDIKRSTLSMRWYKYGWDIERCLTEPVRRR